MITTLIKTKLAVQASILAAGFLLMGASDLAHKGWKFIKWQIKSTVLDKTLSDFQRHRYEKDATRLALRLMSEDQPYDQLEAEVPQEMVSSILNALMQIHHSELEAAKTVTQIHKLHTFPIPSVDHFFVVYQRDAPWSMPLRLGDNTTDSPEINAILKQYGLVIDKHLEWDERKNSFHVKAKKSLNIAAIAKKFSGVEGVVLVDLLMPEGDGNDIELKRLEDRWEFDYKVKFGGCISGCKRQHIWTFQVTDNDEVYFVKESGDTLPDWMK